MAWPDKSRLCHVLHSEGLLPMLTVSSDGLLAIVKRDCPTCELVAPVVAQLAADQGLQVCSQDDPGFPEAVDKVGDDRELDLSHRLNTEIVPESNISPITLEGPSTAHHTTYEQI